MSGPRVERYYQPDTRHPAIVAIGQSCQTQARKGFPRHRHNCTEICLVTGGSIGYFTESEHYLLAPNSVQINQPGQWHGTAGNVLNPCTLTWIQLDLPELKIPEIESRAISLPLRLEQGAARLSGHLDAILAECRHPGPDTRLAQGGRLQLFLVDLLRIAGAHERPEFPTTLRRALELLDQDTGMTLAVGGIAATLNTHRSHLHHLFVKHLGTTPQAYIKEKRLRKAADLLASSPRNISEIAFAMDFASTQHFATAFRKRYGTSPTKFRTQSSTLL